MSCCWPSSLTGRSTATRSRAPAGAQRRALRPARGHGLPRASPAGGRRPAEQQLGGRRGQAQTPVRADRPRPRGAGRALRRLAAVRGSGGARARPARRAARGGRGMITDYLIELLAELRVPRRSAGGILAEVEDHFPARPPICTPPDSTPRPPSARPSGDSGPRASLRALREQRAAVSGRLLARTSAALAAAIVLVQFPAASVAAPVAAPDVPGRPDRVCPGAGRVHRRRAHAHPRSGARLRTADPRGRR